MDGNRPVPVLIVGGGPAGLTASLLLSQLGIASMLIERRPQPSPLPRATGVNVRSMSMSRAPGRAIGRRTAGSTAHAPRQPSTCSGQPSSSAPRSPQAGSWRSQRPQPQAYPSASRRFPPKRPALTGSGPPERYWSVPTATSPPDGRPAATPGEARSRARSRLSSPLDPGRSRAGAFPLDQLMLGHLGPHRRQVKDLATLHPGGRPAGQDCPAPAAAARLMPGFPVRPGHQRQRLALMPVLPARPAAGLLPQRPRRQLGKPLTGGRLGGGSAASASAGPQAQRSAPAPAPVPPAPPPAHCAATPPAPRAPPMRAGLDQRAHRDTMAQDHLADVPCAAGVPDQSGQSPLNKALRY